MMYPLYFRSSHVEVVCHSVLASYPCVSVWKGKERGEKRRTGEKKKVMKDGENRTKTININLKTTKPGSTGNRKS